jgi:hypothetical protein
MQQSLKQNYSQRKGKNQWIKNSADNKKQSFYAHYQRVCSITIYSDNVRSLFGTQANEERTMSEQ